MRPKRSHGRKPLKELSARQRSAIFRDIRYNPLSERVSSLSSALPEHHLSAEIPPIRSENANTSDYPPRPVANVPILPNEPNPADHLSIADDDDELGNESSDDTLLADEFGNDSSDDDHLSQCSFESIGAVAVDRQNFRRELASWVQENSINGVASDKLLHILRAHSCFSDLPKSTKTLLSTPRKSTVLLDVPPGEYLYFGLEAAILSILEITDDDDIPESLEIDISTDGATLDNSRKNQIWPIQCRISNISNSQPEVVGIYRGIKKPDDAMVFFQTLVDEASILIHEGGVMYRGSRKGFTFRAFIADAPARAFVLNHMGHNAESPCSKCCVTGEYVERRMTFVGLDFPPRTDEQYCLQAYEDHQNDCPSPLSLPIGMVTQVPFDYMHLVLLGVVKRLLSAWIDGKFSNSSKLLARDIDLISKRHVKLADSCPREFARPPEDLKYYLRYKATQFRQFLLYTGPAVLFGILDKDYYNHFLLLHTAMRILASTSPSEIELIYAKHALRTFVEYSAILYGRSFVSYNVHGLLHLVDDVKLFGPVDKYSAFPYENSMKIFRQYIRKPELPLQQIANRRAEATRNKNVRGRRADCQTVASGNHDNGPLTGDIVVGEVQQFSCLKSRKFVLSTDKRGNCCLLNDSSICIVVNICVRGMENLLIVRKFDRKEELYETGIEASLLGYFKCSSLRQDLSLVRFEDVVTKCFLMPHWQSYRLDVNDEELVVDDVYIVATMSCEVNY